MHYAERKLYIYLFNLSCLLYSLHAHWKVWFGCWGLIGLSLSSDEFIEFGFYRIEQNLASQKFLLHGDQFENLLWIFVKQLLFLYILQCQLHSEIPVQDLCSTDHRWNFFIQLLNQYLVFFNQRPKKLCHHAVQFFHCHVLGHLSFDVGYEFVEQF